MSLSRGFARGLSLNPNAAEFVPSSLRASSSSASGKQVLDRSDSSVSANSDEEARQYWHHHLPDDITPDFNAEHQHQHQHVSLEGLSLYPTTDSDFPPSMFGDDTSSSPFLQRSTKPWDMTSDHLLANARDVPSFRETATHTNPNPNPNPNPSPNPSPSTDASVAVHFLASHFPGFAVESLAEVYFANSCDLNSTFEMLTQLELQVDGVTNQNMNVKTLSAPNLTSTDFPSLPVPDNKTNLQKYIGDELQEITNPYRSFDKDNLLMFKSGSSLSAKSATDFASAVRKLASQDSAFLKYDRNGSTDAAIGSSRNSHALTGLYNSGAGRSFSDRTPGRGPARAAPVWLDTGDAVANLYADVREEARDRARLRNTYFEQARQAYLVGNKALAKELSIKGHLHNMQMKAAHCKAGESIYRERNPVSPGAQGGGRFQEKMIDLHGLHVNEAIHVLKQELSLLRSAARLANQRLNVYICVGTGHHTRGSRTPARLPIAVQRYLLQEEGLEYSEPQAGLLRVVLY